MKVTKLPYLRKHHKEKHVSWSKYTKVDFITVIFTHEYDDTLDEPGYWMRVWII